MANQARDVEGPADQPSPAISARQAVKAALGIGSSSAIYALMNFVSSLLIARLIGAEEFGVYIVFLTVYGLLVMIIDGGHGRSLLTQRGDLAASASAARSWVRFSALLLLIVTIGGAVSATLVTRQAELPVAVAAASVVALVTSLGLWDAMLLRRHGDVSYIQWTTVASNLAGYLLVGVLVSWITSSWVGPMVATITFAGLVTCFSVHRNRRSGAFRLVETVRTSPRLEYVIFGSLAISWLVAQIDFVTVGKLYGSEALGPYSRSYFLAFAIPSLLTAAAMPLLAQLVRQSDRLNRLSLLSLLLFLLNLPTLIASLAVDDLTELIYGPGFGSRDYLYILVIAGAVWAASFPWSLSLHGMGRKRAEAFGQAIPVPAFVVVVILLPRDSGVVAVAIAVVAGALARLVVLVVARGIATACRN